MCAGNYMRGTSQSAAEYSLSLKKPSYLFFYKILTPTPKLGPQKTVMIIGFRIALTLNVKIVWFAHQVAVCAQKRHKMQFFGVVGFKSSTLTVNCLSS